MLTDPLNDLFEETLTIDSVIKDFEAFILRSSQADLELLAFQKQYDAHQKRMESLDIYMPSFAMAGPRIVNSVKFLLSAKYGRPVGVDCEHLIDLAQHLFETSKRDLIPFGFVLKYFGNQKRIDDNDIDEKYQIIRKSVRKMAEDKDVRLTPDPFVMTFLKHWEPAIYQKCLAFSESNKVVKTNYGKQAPQTPESIRAAVMRKSSPDYMSEEDRIEEGNRLLQECYADNLLSDNPANLPDSTTVRLRYHNRR